MGANGKGGVRGRGMIGGKQNTITKGSQEVVGVRER